MAVKGTATKLANVILAMTYGDLMEVCYEFSQMVDDKDVRTSPKEAADFASLLHDWADAQAEE